MDPLWQNFLDAHKHPEEKPKSFFAYQDVLFLLFLIQNICESTQKNHLQETVLLNAQNKYSHRWIREKNHNFILKNMLFGLIVA